MNIAVAYRFTGENILELEPILGSVCQSLRDCGHTVFCSLEHELEFRKQGYSADQIYDFCRAQFKNHDAILVFLRSSSPSKGIELELDDATAANKTVYVVTPRNVTLYRDRATHVIEYELLEDLCDTLRTRLL